MLEVHNLKPAGIMNSISNTKFDIFCVNPWYPPPNLGSGFSESLPKLLSVIAEQHVVSKKAKKVVYVQTRAIGESLITIFSSLV